MPPKITLQIQKYDSSITLYKIKNEIRRNLGNYIEHCGSNKSGGYYLKSKIINLSNRQINVIFIKNKNNRICTIEVFLTNK